VTIRAGSLVALLRSRSGNAAVEFALIAPLLLGMLLGMIDVGMGFYQEMEVENAAQAGAQYALVKGWDVSAVGTAVAQASTMSDISLAPAPSSQEWLGCASGTAITPSSPGEKCANGDPPATYVTVTAQATYVPIFSLALSLSPLVDLNLWGGSATVPLTAQATIRVQ
jgi:Flp pilus assembly protein TadG